VAVSFPHVSGCWHSFADSRVAPSLRIYRPPRIGGFPPLQDIRCVRGPCDGRAPILYLASKQDDFAEPAPEASVGR
jgi:hypothetical protein